MYQLNQSGDQKLIIENAADFVIGHHGLILML